MFRTLMNMFVTDPAHYEVDLKKMVVPPVNEATQRLEEKRKAAIEYLGEKWIMHPVHTRKVVKNVAPRVLDQIGK